MFYSLSMTRFGARKAYSLRRFWWSSGFTQDKGFCRDKNGREKKG
jgi:hypothetical protein